MTIFVILAKNNFPNILQQTLLFLRFHYIKQSNFMLGQLLVLTGIKGIQKLVQNSIDVYIILILSDIDLYVLYHLFFQTVCMQLTNAIITQPEDLDFRLHLRNEFLRTGLLDILPVSLAVLVHLSLPRMAYTYAQSSVI